MLAEKALFTSSAPALGRRGILIPITWYTGFATRYGPSRYDSILWGLDEWKRFVDWLASYRFNVLYLCCYGYWPFPLRNYPKAVLRDVEFTEWDAEKGQPRKVRWTHPNVENDFLPELVEYAHSLGIQVFLTLGLNSFNGGYLREYPGKPSIQEGQRAPSPVGRLSEPCWSDPENRKYSVTTIGEVFERYAFDGVVFESAECELCKCDDCTSKYRSGADNELQARISADMDWLGDVLRTIREARPGVEFQLTYHWPWGKQIIHRDSPQAAATFLTYLREQLPPDVLICWLPPQEEEEFSLWAEIFGPQRCLHYVYGGQSLWDRTLVYHGSERDLNTIEFVKRETEMACGSTGSPPRVRRGGSRGGHSLIGAFVEADEFLGHELQMLTFAAYAWNGMGEPLSCLLPRAAAALYGDDAPLVLEATKYLNRLSPFDLAQGGEPVEPLSEAALPVQDGYEKLALAKQEGERALALLERCSGRTYFPGSFEKMKTEARRKALNGELLLSLKSAQELTERVEKVKFSDYRQARELAQTAQTNLSASRRAREELHALLAKAYPLMYPSFPDFAFLNQVAALEAKLAKEIAPFV